MRALRFMSLLAQVAVIVKEVGINFILALKTELAVLNLNHSLCLDCFCKAECLSVLFFVLSVRLGNEVEFEVLIRAFTINIYVKVQGDVTLCHFSLS